MALRYSTLKNKPKFFHQLTTFTIEEFNILSKKIHPEWIEREYQRKMNNKNRVNKVGQGHPYFSDFNTLLLLLILYTKTDCSNLLLGLLFEISDQTIFDTSKKLIPLLQDRFIPLTKLKKKRGRINTIDELVKEYPEIKEVIADGTDILTRRPKRKQGKNYSGKSKKHSKKIIIITNPQDGLIIARTKIRPGSVHDKKILEKDNLYKKLNNNEKIIKRTDSAWTGEDESKGWKVNARGRRNNPLTESQKKENKKLSKIRIKVEHSIRRIKVFLRIGGKTCFRAKGKLNTVINVAINLANFKQLMHQPKLA